MFKKLAIGTLATGLLFSGGMSVSAAELNNTVPTVNNLIQASFTSKAYMDIDYLKGKVEFEVWDLQSIFHPEFYEEVIFTLESPDSDGGLSNPLKGSILEDAYPKESNTKNKASDTISNKTLLRNLGEIFGGENNIPNLITVYAYAKPANNSHYWPAGMYDLEINKLR